MPANDPKIVVYIAVDNAKGVSQYGGTVAAPLARNFLQSAIPILNISQQANEIEKEFVYLDKTYSEVPDTTGMSLKEAMKALKKFKVEYEGEGSVRYQSPQAGMKIADGETIRLYLG